MWNSRTETKIGTFFPERDDVASLCELWKIETIYHDKSVISYELKTSEPKNQVFNFELTYKGTLSGKNASLLDTPFSLFNPDFDANSDPNILQNRGSEILKILSHTHHCETDLDPKKPIYLGYVLHVIGRDEMNYHIPIACKNGEIFYGQAIPFEVPSIEEQQRPDYFDSLEKNRTKLLEDFIATLIAREDFEHDTNENQMPEKNNRE